MSETPKVLILGPITPTASSRNAETLEYTNLKSAAERASSHDTARQDVFWNSPEDTLEEEATARQLASQYLLMTADKQTSALNLEKRQLWADRYTEATIELYGAPNTEVARDLLISQAFDLKSLGAQAGVDNDLLAHYVDLTGSFGVENIDQARGINPELYETSLQISEYLNDVYGEVFSALDLESSSEKINAHGIVDKFRAGLTVLADKFDSAWAEWGVQIDETKDSLSVVAGKKKIIVGIDRVDVTPAELKGLFAHEVLLHAQRAVNGAKVSEKMRSGLSGYLDAEEGLGSFMEYAITGNIPDKNVDRYVDISLALGQIDGVKRTRRELIDLATTRALIRNECLPVELRKDNQDIQDAAITHINRIFRGTTGDEHGGVFTKDHVYQTGFMEMGAYINQELNRGATVGDVMKYLLMGKFDPTNQKHVDYMHTIMDQDR